MKLIYIASIVVLSCFGNSWKLTLQPSFKQAKNNITNKYKPAIIMVCTTLQCLEQNEGQVIDIEGVYLFPKQEAFAVNKLALKDKTTIILDSPKNELKENFIDDNNGMRMRIRGRIFTGTIPEKYRIIGRTSEPYLLELEKVEKFGHLKIE